MENGDNDEVAVPAAIEIPAVPTKQSIRLKVWKCMSENNLVMYKRVVYNRIPNFKNSAEAAQKLSELEEFTKAKTVLVNPDKPLEPYRLLALEKNKTLIVPVPRLQSLLSLLEAPEGAGRGTLRRIITRQGIEEGKLIGLHSDLKIDLMVIGSVAVTRNGYRIGKGQGYTDLEFAIIQHMGVLTNDVLIVTVVHDCQVLDPEEVPVELFGPHDVPIDIIVTPTQVIHVTGRPPRPTQIIWNLLSQRRIDMMPMLKKIKAEEQAAGKIIVLKEVDTDIEESGWVRQGGQRRFFSNNKRKPRKASNRQSESEPNDGDGDASEQRRIRVKNQFRRGKKNSENQENEQSDAPNQNNRIVKKKRARKPRQQIEFSVKVGNIAKTDRVRDIKSALAERGVKPMDITWRGVKGFCYLHFAMKPEGEQTQGVDSIIESLSGLSVGGGESGSQEGAPPVEPHVLTVEPAKPISRIETTDVTAV